MPPLYRADELVSLLETRKSILCVGPPFTGKTRSLWTLVQYLKDHDLGPLVLFDLDQKCESLVVVCKEKGLLDYLVIHRLSAPDRVEEGSRRVDKNKEIFLDFLQQFNSYHKLVDPKTATWKLDAPIKPGAIFIDSLSKFSEIVLEYVVGDIGHDIGEKGTDARSDFGKQINKVKQTVDSLKSFPCITGWIAHDQLMKNEIDGKIVSVPNIIGKWATQLAKEFNCVLYSCLQQQGDKNNYVWQVQPKDWVRSAGVTSKSNLPTFIPQDYREIL